MACAFGVRERSIVAEDRAAVGRQHAREALEQRRLAGAVRTDEAEHLAAPDGERDVAQGCQVSVAFGEIGDDRNKLNLSGRADYYQPP